MPTQTADREIMSVEECAQVIIDQVKQLRAQADISHDREVSIYVTDVPLIHSTLSEYEERIRQQTNASDIVQVNVKAGNPMPKNLTQVELHTLDDGPAIIAIEE